MIEELKQLGLGNYESKALEILLKEKLSLRNLSKKAQIPFGKVYSVVKSLKEKGFVQETNSRPKLIYVENASEVISKLIKEKQEKDRSFLERLREASIEIDRNKGKESKFFEIGTTIEENKRIQLRSFKEAENEVLQIINIHHKPQSNRESKTLWEKEIVKAVGRGVVFKAIYPEKIKLPIILEKLNKKHPDKFQVKRFNTDFTRCDIIDGKKVLLKLVQEDPLQFGGVLFLENEKLAENLIKIFSEMWENGLEFSDR
jgi:sugar-specific transcriptional regulator TrmB